MYRIISKFQKQLATLANAGQTSFSGRLIHSRSSGEYSDSWMRTNPKKLQCVCLWKWRSISPRLTVSLIKVSLSFYTTVTYELRLQLISVSTPYISQQFSINNCMSPQATGISRLEVHGHNGMKKHGLVPGGVPQILFPSL